MCFLQRGTVVLDTDNNLMLTVNARSASSSVYTQPRRGAAFGLGFMTSPTRRSDVPPSRCRCSPFFLQRFHFLAPAPHQLPLVTSLGPSLTGLSAPLPTRCPRSLYRLTMSGVSHLTPYRFVPSFTGFLFLLASHAQVAAVMNPRIVPLLSPLRLYISLLW